MPYAATTSHGKIGGYKDHGASKDTANKSVKEFSRKQEIVLADVNTHYVSSPSRLALRLTESDISRQLTDEELHIIKRFYSNKQGVTPRFTELEDAGHLIRLEERCKSILGNTEYQYTSSTVSYSYEDSGQGRLC